MAKALGVGGVFFKSKDSARLAEWYRDCLGVPVEPPFGASFSKDSMPPGSYTVWAPFQQDTDYFEPSTKEFMINLVVDDLRGALEQVRKAGATVMDKIDDHEFGLFGWFTDPEGNKVELWQPKQADPS